MIFELENGNRLENIKKDDLDKYLRKINGSSNSYAVLEAEDGSYIQVGGGPVEFTVEVRHISSDDEFFHWKARKKHSQSEAIKKIIISGSLVDVQSNQIIDLETVISLFNEFYDSKYLSSIVAWDNITNEFL
jgi:hypothetical protein